MKNTQWLELVAACALALGISGCGGGSGVHSGDPAELSPAQIDEAERSEISTATAISHYRSYDEQLAANAVLLYLTAFATTTDKAQAAPLGNPVMRTLDAANIAAWAFDSPLQFESPLMTLVGMGVLNSDDFIKIGYEEGLKVLRTPSLILVGTQTAAGATLGTPAYGAIMDRLFAQGDSLLHSAGLGCEPVTKYLHSRSLLHGELLSGHIGSIWFPNVLRTRGYACSQFPGNATDSRNLNFLGVWPSPEPSDAVRQAVGTMALTGTVTAMDDPFVMVSFKNLSQYPGYAGNDGAWKLLEKLQDAMPVGWYFVIGGSMPGEASGPMQVAVGQKTSKGFTVARYGFAS